MTSRALGRILAASPLRVAAGQKRLYSLLSAELEFPGLPTLKPEKAKATTGSVSTLPNGLTVVTEDACTTSTVSITYPKAGSASEMLDEEGAALANRCLSFKSGSGVSTLMINRTLENEGAIHFTSLDRFGATLGFTVMPDKAIELIPLLATDCSFEKWDLRDAKKLAAIVVEEANSSAQIVLTENLFAAAFGPQSTAGRSMYYSDVTTDAIKSFRQRGYGMQGAILTATGVKDHAAFCTAVTELLTDAPAGSAEAGASNLAYFGGESRIAAPSSGYAHVALGFQGPTSSVITGVLKHLLNLLGGENDVSAFSTHGIIGLYAGSADSSGLTDSMVKTIKSTISPDVVKRAKNLAKAEALLAMDGGSKTLAQFMTAYVKESGSFTGPADVAKAYDAVTEAQVQTALATMLKNKPSLAAIGDIRMVPYHATIVSQLS